MASSLFQGARPEVEYMDVLFAQRDLLEACADWIDTKQQQLAAIVRVYQALGGGYLMTTAGMELAELFCYPELAEMPNDSTDVDVEPVPGSMEIIPFQPEIIDTGDAEAGN